MHDRLRYAVESNRDRRSGQGTKRGRNGGVKEKERERKRERERGKESNEGRNNTKSQWRLTSHDYSSDNDRPQTPDLCMMNAPTYVLFASIRRPATATSFPNFLFVTKRVIFPENDKYRRRYLYVRRSTYSERNHWLKRNSSCKSSQFIRLSIYCATFSLVECICWRFENVKTLPSAESRSSPYFLSRSFDNFRIYVWRMKDFEAAAYFKT